MRFNKSATNGTGQSTQDRQAQDAGAPAIDPYSPVDPWNLTPEQSLNAELTFQQLCGRIADLAALEDERSSELKNSSTWILVYPGKLRRYKLLDGFDPRLRLLLNFDSFAELHAVWLAAGQPWEEMAKDMDRFDAWLRHGKLVDMCVDSTHRGTQQLLKMTCNQRKQRQIRRPQRLVGRGGH